MAKTIAFAYTDAGRVCSGFVDEEKDCAVRAYSTFKDVDYATAHALFAEHGRKNGAATYNTTIATILNGVQLHEGGMTLGRLLERFPSGKLYVLKRGHAFAVVDGCVHDNVLLGPKTKILRFWTDAQPQVKIDHAVSALTSVREQVKTLFIAMDRTNKSNYLCAQEIASKLGITTANAYYHVRNCARSCN